MAQDWYPPDRPWSDPLLCSHRYTYRFPPVVVPDFVPERIEHSEICNDCASIRKWAAGERDDDAEWVPPMDGGPRPERHYWAIPRPGRMP
jgi:hypothetical protein